MADRVVAGPFPQLLAYAAQRLHGPDERTFDACGADLDEGQLEQVVRAGLAPLMCFARRGTLAELPEELRHILLAADRTQRVRHGAFRDTAEDVIDAGQARGVTLTLLKGISVCDQFYPEPHQRPMGDVDVLVDRRDLAAVENELRSRGYVERPDYEADEFEPHGTPLAHPRLGVWVEVHTGLFPEDEVLRQNRLFGAETFSAKSVSSQFNGRPVYRLADELQLVYIASYWLRDLTREGFHPSFVVPLLDTIYLLKTRGASLDWDGVHAQIDNERAKASLYLLLYYMASRGFAARDIPVSFLDALASGQSIVGPVERRIICAMLDDCLVGDATRMASFIDRHPMIGKSILAGLLAEGSHAGKLLSLPWSLFFPPQVPERYSLQFQRERIAHVLSRRPASTKET